MKFSGERRRECAVWSHAYLSGEIRVGDMMEPVGECSPIIALPEGFHGESGGTREAYGPCLGTESLSGSPSSITMCRRSVCGRRGRRAGDVGGVLVGCRTSGGDIGRFALSFVRVGACADELRLMGVALAV